MPSTTHLRTKGRSIWLADAAEPTVGQALIITSATGNEITAAYGNPAAVSIAVTPLVDNTTGTPGATLAAITSPVPVTNNSGGSTADTVIAAITQAGTAGSADFTPTQNAIAKLAVLGNANATAVGLLKNDIASLNTLLTTLISQLNS